MLRWIGGGLVRDEQQTTADIETFERWWDQHGFGVFAMGVARQWRADRLRRAGGTAVAPRGDAAVEIGWRLGRAFWGATEAAAATLRFGLIGRHLGQVISIAQVGNGASEHIMGKLGMRLARETR